MRAIQKYGSCTPALPESPYLFEVSRELHHHGETEGVPPNRTVYYSARKSFRTRLEELSEITDPDFSFMRDLDIRGFRPSIVTTYGHEVYNASEGRPGQVAAFHDQFRSSQKALAKEGEKDLVFGPSMFSKVVSTVIHVDPEVFIFTLQPDEELYDDQTIPAELSQLQMERWEQARIMAKAVARRSGRHHEEDNFSTRHLKESRKEYPLGPGILLGQLSLGDLQRKRWADLSEAERSVQAENFYFGAAALTLLVNEDVGKALHPSKNLVSFTARASEHPEYLPESQEFTAPQPRREMFFPYGGTPTDREQVVFATSVRDRLGAPELKALISEAAAASTLAPVAQKYGIDEATLKHLVGSEEARLAHLASASGHATPAAQALVSK